MLKFLFGLVPGIFCLVALQAQDPYYIKYDTKGGMPTDEVYDVEIDSSGLVWFTTDRGVSTYDGYEFKTYTTQDGLADNTNFDIYRDSNNRLWFNGYSGRLSIYQNGVFQAYPYNDSLLSAIERVWVGDMLASKSNQIFAATYASYKLNLFHLRENDYPKILDEEEVRATFNVIDVPNAILVEINEKAICFAVGGETANNKLKYTNTLAEYTGNAWYYIVGSKLYKSNLQGQELEHINLGNTIARVYVDDQNSIWVCTVNGLFFFENGILNQGHRIYFKGYHISNIAKDMEGGYWLTTHQNGVLYVPSFEIDILQSSRDEVAQDRFLSIGKLKDHIFFGTSDSRIIAVDRNSRVEKLKTKKNTFIQIRYIIENDQELYFSNDKRLKEENGKIVFVKNIFPNLGYLKRLKNQQFFQFGTRGFLIHSVDSYVYSSIRNRPNSFKENPTVIAQTNDEAIWIGTLSGLYKVSNYEYSSIDQVLYNGRDTFGRINDIYLDPLENRWIATIGNGLFYHSKDKVFQIRKADGLNSDLINHLVMINDTTLWIGTNKGLNILNYHFIEDSLSFYNIKSLTTTDGLGSNYINDINYWQGKIWLATNNGISRFDPGLINKHYPPVPVTIKEFIVNDSSRTISNNMIFDYNENDIFINFTGISFKKETEKPFYRYRLKTNGDKPQWFYSNEKNIRYNNMSPGGYTFEVTAQNRSGQWNEIPASVSFKIMAHFTETLWFRMLAIILTLGVISLGGYFRIKRIRSRESGKRQLQEAQLRIREAELAALRNQMNPHFVFNSLNSIQNFIFKKDIEKANYYLSKFSELMRNSLLYTRLDFITLREELDFIKNYLELESMRFAGKFDFTLEVDEELDLDYTMIPSLLLQPILENVVKHAFKNIKYKGRVEVAILQKGESSLDIYIRDNGPGLPQNINIGSQEESKHKSLGLEIIQNRIKLLNEADYKTKASVIFKNLSEIDSNKKGFQAHFILPIKYKQ